MESRTSTDLRRALIVGTGGTISMTGRSAYDWIEYGESGRIRSIEEVVAELEPLLAGVAVESVSFETIPSTNVEWRHWVGLARAIRASTAERRDVQGIVVTHGTASLEDTAWFLDLVHDSAVPVVLVGAQRPPNTRGSDAAPNLRAALAVATCEQSRGLGVLVVMNGHIFAARDATKLSNFALDAFGAAEFGPLGRVEPDGSVLFRRIPIRHCSQSAGRLARALDESRPARVDLALSYPGADGTAIRAFQDAGAAAIISVGMPPGRSTAAERAALREAVASGVLVVQASRAIRGSVLPQQYTKGDNIQPGGDIAAHKLRILVMLALTAALSAPEIAALLADI